MTITVYAAMPDEKQITARHAIQTLGEHYTAFLNHNNISTWAADEGYALGKDSISDILLSIGSSRGLYIGQIQYQAKRIRKLTRVSGVQVKLQDAYNMIARALGYPRYQTAFNFRDRDDYVDNLWPHGNALDMRLLNSESEPGNSSDIYKKFRDRATYNKQRAQATNELRKIAKSNNPLAKEAHSTLQRQRKRRISKNATAPIFPRE